MKYMYISVDTNPACYINKVFLSLETSGISNIIINRKIELCSYPCSAQLIDQKSNILISSQYSL